jgi:hypothetical protein
MGKIKFSNILKYVGLTTLITCVVIPFNAIYNREGNGQMIAGTVIIGIISLPLIYGMIWLLLANYLQSERPYFYSPFCVHMYWPEGQAEAQRRGESVGTSRDGSAANGREKRISGPMKEKKKYLRM